MKPIGRALQRLGRSTMTFLLCIGAVLNIFTMSPMQVSAVNATLDNPVLFKVSGSIVSGAVQYGIGVLDIYNQTYQSFNITYPAELNINYPTSGAGNLTTIWNISGSSGSGTKTTTFIIKTGTRSAAQLQADLQSIYFTLANPPDGFPPENSKVSISASATKVTAFVDDNGYVHWYTFVANTSANWLTAYNSAKNSYMQDPRYPDDPARQLQGYLATITSQAEQDKVYNDIATECGWLGGTRMLIRDNPGSDNGAAAKPILDPTSLISIANQFNYYYRTNTGPATTNTDTQYWYWACGPEAGQIFYTQPRASVSGARTPNPATETAYNIPAGFTGWAYYSYWTSGEPNNSDSSARDGGRGGEYVLQFAWSGSPRWNDYSHANQSAIAGYYIEYGGYPGDPKADELGGSDISTSSEVQLVLPVVAQYRSTEKDSTNNFRQITGIGTTYDRLQNYEQFLPYTALRNPGGLPGNIPRYTPYGYEFFGQTDDRNNLAVNASGDVSGFFSQYNQRIVFLYKPDTLQVNFDANFPDCTNADVTFVSKSVFFDTPYGVLPIAARSGYIFTGWFTDDTGGVEVTADTTVTAPGTHTLYAHWVLKTGYIVRHDLNGSGTSPASIPDKINVQWSDTGLLPSSDPTRAGYIFVGWDVSVNGSKQGVSNSDPYSLLARSDTDSFITLQAQWVPEEQGFTVIYHTNGATAPASYPNDILSSAASLVTFPNPIRTGFIFAGWRVADNGTGSSGGDTYYTPGLEIAFGDLSGTGSKFIVLEAQWTAKQYTVKFDRNDDVSPSQFGSDREEVLWFQLGLVPAPAGTPVYAGYLFMGWNTEPDGSGRIVYASDTYAALAGDDSVSEITLYAQWLAERTFFVQYDLNGGGPVLSDKTGVYFGSDNLLPSVSIIPPTGYDFACW